MLGDYFFFDFLTIGFFFGGLPTLVPYVPFPYGITYSSSVSSSDSSSADSSTSSSTSSTSSASSVTWHLLSIKWDRRLLLLNDNIILYMIYPYTDP